MENKQTAVEWLTYKIEEQRENGNVDLRTTLFYCEQAKAMEKEQIENAYKDSTSQFSVDARMDYPKSAEQYYKEKFNK